jgi:undecaprenyl-diphosphatase
MGILTRLGNRLDLVIEALLKWDEETLQAISEHPYLKRLSGVFIVATYLGDGYLWGGLALGLILFGRPIDRTYVLIGLGVMIVNIAIFRMFKLLFARPRPLLVTSPFRSRFIDTYSFPSGHATTSFALAWVIFTYYPNIFVQLGAYFAAITISLSRVYVKEHYPLDVICGALLGSLSAIYLIPLFERLLF